MTSPICIEIDRCEGTLLRILGLVERRGFLIETLVLSALDEDKRLLVLTVTPRDPSRSLTTLGLQIDRLYGLKRLNSDLSSPLMAEAHSLDSPVEPHNP